MDDAVKNRFWSKVTKTDDCWLWIAKRERDGYGRFKFETKMVYAHRISWELVNGPIPSGLQILHHCDNPPCVNPDHLFLGTPKDNAKDRNKKGRQSKGTRHRSASGGPKHAKIQSQFKGVVWHKHANKWHARARLNGKYISLGYFNNEEHAARAYESFIKEADL